MAFTLATFALDGSHANKNIPRTHTYNTADTQATVNTAGYFNAIADQLEVGDRIEAWVDNAGTPAAVTLYVNSNAAGVVDVADGDALTATDSD